jgi:hypothetical protein
VHDLHQTVHPRVGAARAQGADPVRSKAAQGRFKMILDRVARQLALPALDHPGFGCGL